MQLAAAHRDIFSVMTVPAETVAAAAVVLAGWGIGAAATPLTGARDRNFHLLAEDGREPPIYRGYL